MTESWYEIVTGSALAQGDLLMSCPILRVAALEKDPSGAVEVVEEEHDVIVLTQSCDLENDKVDELLVAAVRGYRPLVAQEGAANSMLRSKDFRRAAVRGNLPSYSLLQARSQPPELEWSLVDFHHLFSLRKSWARGVAEQLGDRLRLKSPYREHLAQAFARYIMRVGLPTHLDDFESYDAQAPSVGT